MEKYIYLSEIFSYSKHEFIIDIEDVEIHIDKNRAEERAEKLSMLSTGKRCANMPSSDITETYSNIRYKIQNGFEPVCIDLYVHGLYLSLDCLFIKVKLTKKLTHE